MNTSLPAGTTRPRRAFSTLLILTLMALTCVFIPSAPAVAADADWRLTATANGDTFPAGSRVIFTLSVTPRLSGKALVDVEVFDGRGAKAFQHFWDNQDFSAGQSRTFTTTWTVPVTQRASTYHVKVGIFRAGWGELYAWHDSADTFAITGSTATTTTSTTTAAPTTTARPTTTTAAPTTTARPTTTTAAPTTTARPTTTTAPPTTTAAPPTTAAPAGMAFAEDFATSAGFTTRFDTGWSGQDPATWPDSSGPIRSWHGDHDGACNGPTTTRTVNVANKAEIFWWCAPGGDTAKGHLMTGVNTAGYNIAWFSPKQWFSNVRRVCWDQNLTDLGGGKWTQVVLVSEAEISAFRGDLGVTGPGFQQHGGPTTGIHPSDSSVNSGVGGAKMMRGGFEIWRGGQVTGSQGWWSSNGGSGSQGLADKAARYQHCMIDNENGTVTLTQARPGGTVATSTVSGDLPDGRVRVVFQDDNYDPDKHGGTSTPGDPRYTWHWDNIQIS